MLESWKLLCLAFWSGGWVHISEYIFLCVVCVCVCVCVYACVFAYLTKFVTTQRERKRKKRSGILLFMILVYNLKSKTQMLMKYLAINFLSLLLSMLLVYNSAFRKFVWFKHRSSHFKLRP